MQNQPQNQQWFNKQQQLQQQAQQQQQQQQQQPIIIQRQMQGMNNFAGPAGYMPRARQPQMGGNMSQGGYQGVFNAEQQQQQQQQQGMKPNQQQQNAGGVLPSQLQGIQGHQVVMGPPGSQSHMQQQMMQNVRSPPPIASPQATQSPRPAPSPRALPSPHHLPSHSPAPGGDMHNHLGHPHQSPLPAGGPMGDNVMNDTPMNAQEQLSKFVEKL
jgi:E1A/CREB-binding protein